MASQPGKTYVSLRMFDEQILFGWVTAWELWETHRKMTYARDHAKSPIVQVRYQNAIDVIEKALDGLGAI